MNGNWTIIDSVPLYFLNSSFRFSLDGLSPNLPTDSVPAHYADARPSSEFAARGVSNIKEKSDGGKQSEEKKSEEEKSPKKKRKRRKRKEKRKIPPVADEEPPGEQIPLPRY